MDMRKAVEEAAAARKAAEQRAAAARAAAEANMTTALFHGKHPVGTLLRKEPKLDRNFNGYELVNDLRVRVLEKNAGNGMTKVEYAGQLGFVRSEYLSKYREEAKVTLTMERKAAEEKAAAEKGAAARKAEAAAAARKAEAARRRNAAVGKVRVRAGALIDQIEFRTRGSGPPKVYGGNGGVQQPDFDLGDGEWLTKVEHRRGNSLDAVRFTTSKGRVSQWYGNVYGGASMRPFIASEGKMIVGLKRAQGGFCPGLTDALYEDRPAA
eukprot:7385902-Prymnesium_polylepis.1